LDDREAAIPGEVVALGSTTTEYAAADLAGDGTAHPVIQTPCIVRHNDRRVRKLPSRYPAGIIETIKVCAADDIWSQQR
jgi:hypothetical protein